MTLHYHVYARGMNTSLVIDDEKGNAILSANVKEDEQDLIEVLQDYVQNHNARERESSDPKPSTITGGNVRGS